jgi:hypothetical protein
VGSQFPGMTTSMSAGPNKKLEVLGPSTQSLVLEPLGSVLTLCFVLINLFLLNSPLCPFFSSFSDETKNLLAHDL